MNAVISYCRISVFSEDGVSLEMQQARATAWCTAQGSDYHLEGVYVETMSGAKASNRPELQKALSHVCKLKGTLLVFSLSRLARNTKDCLEIVARLDRSGAALCSLTERIDTNSALGKMVFVLLSGINEFEKSQLGERTRAAMSHLRLAGKRISARLPLGHDLAPDGETLVPNAAEQETLSRIIAWRNAGKSMNAIARDLTAAGVPTKMGGRWSSSGIRSILKRQQRLHAA
jgi:site-specific DNA recombinase